MGKTRQSSKRTALDADLSNQDLALLSDSDLYNRISQHLDKNSPNKQRRLMVKFFSYFPSLEMAKRVSWKKNYQSKKLKINY